MVLDRLAGLDDGRPTPVGLYFPHQLLEPSRYLARLEQIGGEVRRLEVL